MPTRRARIRRRVYRILPEWAKKHDFEIFAAILGIIIGSPILAGQVEPASPEALLPRPLVLSWATVMVVGCMAILIGVIRSTQLVYPYKIFWMRVEATGLTALCYFCYIYAICILIVTPHTGWPPSLFIIGFGVVSHIREVTIQIEMEQYRRSLGLTEKP